MLKKRAHFELHFTFMSLHVNRLRISRLGVFSLSTYLEACTRECPKAGDFTENETKERKRRKRSFEIVVIEFVTSESGTHRRENDYTHAGSILIKSRPAE